MHSGSSNIKVPVDVSVDAKGRAIRDGDLAPTQSFVQVERYNLKPGDWVMNPGTNQLHRVVRVSPLGIVMNVDPTSDEETFAEWDDAVAALWKVVE